MTIHDDEDVDDLDDDEQWTSESLTSLKSATTRLMETLDRHLALLEASTSDGSRSLPDGWFEAIASAGLGYADAHWQYTGTSGPFAVFHELADEDDEDDEDEELLVEGHVISVLQRADYVVVNEDDVFASAKDAAARTAPDSGPVDERLGELWLGSALYEIAHAGGWDSLASSPGLEPLGSIIRVVAHVPDEPALREEPDGEPFAVDGQHLFTEENAYVDRS